MKKVNVFCVLFCIFLLCSGCAENRKKGNEKDTAKPSVIQSEEAVSLEQSTDNSNTIQKIEKKNDERGEKEQITNGKTIVIDPGHSSAVAEGTEPLGPDSQEYKAADTAGTSGIRTGMPEYELTLKVSEKLKNELEKRGYTVVMTRETSDKPLSCVQRAEVANKLNADAFIRIHANGSDSSEVQGAMAICTTSENPYAGNLYSQSRALSDCIINSLCKSAGCKNNGVWETDSMSGNNWSRVPVTIAEIGYMTNPQEEQQLVTEEYQEQIAQGIAEGTDRFLIP